MPIRLAPLEAYELWSETWETDPSAIVALEFRWAATWLNNLQGKTVFDLSCGVGRWLAHAQAQGATVFGTDVSREMLLHASKKPGLPGRLALADTRHLPLPTHCADLALCALSLGHMKPMESAVSELARIVRRGGRLILTDFHPDALRRGWKRTFRRNGQLYEIETYPYTKERLVACARESGLVLEQLLEPGFDKPERVIFQQAGKPELFDQVRGLPAVLLARWRRP